MRLLLSVLLLSATTMVAAHSKTVLVYGDSLSAGYGIAREQSWPSLLAIKLAAEKNDYIVVNASISGETTAGGLARLPQTLRAHHPAIVIIALGANDGLRGLSLSAMQDNLVAMIGTAKSAKAKVLLVGMKLPPNYGLDYTSQFAQSFIDVAKRGNIAFLPFLLEPIAGSSDAFQADNLHPVASVQPELLNHVWLYLRPLLK